MQHRLQPSRERLHPRIDPAECRAFRGSVRRLASTILIVAVFALAFATAIPTATARAAGHDTIGSPQPSLPTIGGYQCQPVAGGICDGSDRVHMGCCTTDLSCASVPDRKGVCTRVPATSSEAPVPGTRPPQPNAF